MREEETRRAEQMVEPTPSLPAPPPEPQDDELPISLPSDGGEPTPPSLPATSRATPTPVSEPSVAKPESDAPVEAGRQN